LTLKKTFSWTLFILWLMFVIFLSCQSGNDSGKLSLWLAERFDIHVTQTALREFAHFGTHFVLAIFMYGAAYSSYDSPRGFTTIIGFVIAVADELLQFFIPGRCPEIVDIALNLAGIITGAILCAIFAPKKNRP